MRDQVSGVLLSSIIGDEAYSFTSKHSVKREYFTSYLYQFALNEISSMPLQNACKELLSLKIIYEFMLKEKWFLTLFVLYLWEIYAKLTIMVRVGRVLRTM